MSQQLTHFQKKTIMGYLGFSEKKSYGFKILIDFHSDFKQAVGMCIRLRNNHQKSVTKSTEG